jgi:HK97 family phage portal protein
MGWFKKKKAREEVREESKESLLLEAILRGAGVDKETALSIPVISGYVDLICNTFAMIPFKLYKETVKDGKRTTEEVTDDRVRIINEDTTDTLDGFQFKKAICEDYLLGKGGYAYIKKIGNNFVGLFYVKENQVSFNKNTDAIFKNFDIMVDAKTYKNYEFLKLLRNSKDGASGTGLTTEISKALETAYQRLKYELELTLTGGSRKGFIKSQKHLDDKAMKKLKEAWENYYSGNANTVILNDGMEFQEASNNSQQNEIDAKNKTFADDMKTIFHIGNTYDDFIKNAIMPIAVAFATALNRDFLLEKEKKSYYFAPDTKELYKGSMKERFEAYAIAIEKGFKTRNEIRYMEDDDAINGLDIINLGLGDVLLNAETGEIYTPNTNTTITMGENGSNSEKIGANNEVSNEGDINAHEETNTKTSENLAK